MKWKLKNYNSNYLISKSKEFQESKLITKLLLNRGITTPEKVEEFLNPSEKDLYSPFLFEEMREVVDRILRAKNNREKVVIYGDYDVDGISGTAYLVIILRKLGMDVDYYIPNRAHEGVGINKSLIRYLKKRNTKLFITVDITINDRNEIKLLRDNNIDVIITDHHRQIEDIRDLGVLMVNPKVGNYPNKNLSGSGVAFKLADAIYEVIGADKKILYDYIDIVMIGTVADVVPMTDENRFIIKKGLSNLKETKIKGLKYIINYLRMNPQNITASDIGFYIAPIFNALGRVDNSKMVVNFFIQEDDEKLYSIIEKKSKQNA